MQDPFLKTLFEAHCCNKRLPSPDSVSQLADHLLQLLFPELSEKRYTSLRELQQDYEQTRLEFFRMMEIIEKVFPLKYNPQEIEEVFYKKLPQVRESLLKDAHAICEGDPAATSTQEVIRTYPGFLAIAIYRLAHELYTMEVPLIPRVLTEYAHSLTGIEIHPGAKVGEYFCIDHGTGIVIGQTAEIGNYVKLYQGVTLGALSVSKDMKDTKRHPTIEDNVIIYAGATILGGETVVGHDTIIGGSVWLTKSIAPHSRLYHQPQIKQKNDNLKSVKI